MKPAIALLSLLLSCSAFAAATASDGSLPKYVLQDLDPGVHRLDHSIYTYHYINPESIGLPPGDFNLNDPRITQHVALAINYYRDRSQDAPKDVSPDGVTSVPGIGGYYAALDPGSSEAWAQSGKEFLAYRLELPQGFSYLDITDRGVTQFSPKTREYLEKSGCQAENFTQLFWWNLGPSCRTIAIQAVNALGIGAIKYPFAAEKICGANGPVDPSAFIIVNTDQVPADGVRVFDHDASQDPDGGLERNILRAISAQEDQGLVTSNASQVPQGSDRFDLSPSAYDQEQNQPTCSSVLQYEKLHLLNCLPQ